MEAYSAARDTRAYMPASVGSVGVASATTGITRAGSRPAVRLWPTTATRAAIRSTASPIRQ
jgi:hypothetical protein